MWEIQVKVIDKLAIMESSPIWWYNVFVSYNKYISWYHLNGLSHSNINRVTVTEYPAV